MFWLILYLFIIVVLPHMQGTLCQPPPQLCSFAPLVLTALCVQADLEGILGVDLDGMAGGDLGGMLGVDLEGMLQVGVLAEPLLRLHITKKREKEKTDNYCM